MNLISLCVLCIGFVLCRYVFFEAHGMKDWPLYLFLCGLIVIGISFAAKAGLVSVFTSLFYIIGFAAGLLFQTEGVDAGGGRANNLWIIWTVVFACAVVSSCLGEIVRRKHGSK